MKRILNEGERKKGLGWEIGGGEGRVGKKVGCPGRKGRFGTPIYFLYRDFPLVRVSFSGSSVSNRVRNFPFLS